MHILPVRSMALMGNALLMRADICILNCNELFFTACEYSNWRAL